MAEFNIAYEQIAAVEGEYSNLSTDRGGETYKGISRKFHPDAAIWKYVDRAKEISSSPEQISNHLRMNMNAQGAVVDFYKAEYWDAIRLGEIVSQKVATELCDTAVNQGKVSAVKYLQEALNLCNQNGRIYKDIAVDGVLGNMTLLTLERCMNYYERYGQKYAENLILKTLNGLQFIRYVNIVKNDPSQEVNFAGWISWRID